MRAAAVTVLVATALILFYLVRICLPLIGSASVGAAEALDLPAGFRYAIRQTDGSLWRLAKPPGAAEGVNGPLYSSGNRVLLQQGERLHLYDLVPRIAFGEALAEVVPDARWVGQLRAPRIRGPVGFDSGPSQSLAAWFDAGGTLPATRLPTAIRATRSGDDWALPSPSLGAGTVLVDAALMQVLVVQGDRYLRWQLPGDADGEGYVRGGKLPGLQGESTVASWGPGRDTLLVATRTGELRRFDTARRDLPLLGTVRLGTEPLRWISSERDRRVAALLSADSELIMLVPETGETLLRRSLADLPASAQLLMSANGAWLYALADRPLMRWSLEVTSPETGWRSLWLAQQYSAYDEPVHSWHPEGSAIGVLPKYALSPLLWGTFKAALYGMLVAIPIALGAAIYTGYFLPPRRRNQVKPAVEMLEAFPTVVLGFLAGLWLAPLLADHLAVVFLAPLLAVALPLVLALLNLLLQRLAPQLRRRPPRIALLAFLYALLVVFLLVQADRLETVIFSGSMRDWLWNTLGIRYDQRNALLVGLAMGLAITPIMFSIIEDAINAVPRSLSDGSLALGATRWQSLARVVMPAASPAILSALLIGLARGLGETMIVLLASGNAPLMEPDPFSGLRTLAASIAAELPEADAGGVHFRVLFLAALVLFALTFVLNTVAELFRQRLRYAYAGR